MIITISGKPGSGKSTVSKIISKKLNLKHYSMGDFQRQIAKEKGLSINELGKLEEQSDEIDKLVEQKQIDLGKKEDNFIIDSRLGFYCIPNSIKIFLDVSLEESAKRIFKDKRAEENFKDEESLKKHLIDRAESEKKRYKEYYDIDFNDLDNYNLVVDTTNIDIGGVVNKILNFINNQ
ncbi:cytidylate kinase [Candidatus Woesearchaeota archaeon B3_Woes]|nr:MAG: cytidylate kinase [Candidatus Woesearchaeota archaeon B3_Woes]